MAEIKEAFQAWVKNGRPIARWNGLTPDTIASVKIGEDEIVPQSFQVLRNFKADEGFRIRLVRAGECYLLGAEHGVEAGTTMNTGLVMGMMPLGVTFVATARAFVFPIDSGLDQWEEDDLSDLYAFASGDHARQVRTDQRGITPLVHHENDLISASVIDKESKFRMKLAFGIEVWGNGDIDYLYNATRVPPTLRSFINETEFVEPEADYPDAGKLVEVCNEMAGGRFEFKIAACEPPNPGEGEMPRRLVRIQTSSALLYFAVSLDSCSHPALRDILARLVKTS